MKYRIRIAVLVALAFLLMALDAGGAIRQNPITTATPAEMTNVITGVIATDNLAALAGTAETARNNIGAAAETNAYIWSLNQSTVPLTVRMGPGSAGANAQEWYEGGNNLIGSVSMLGVFAPGWLGGFAGRDAGITNEFGLTIEEQILTLAGALSGAAITNQETRAVILNSNLTVQLATVRMLQDTNTAADVYSEPGYSLAIGDGGIYTTNGAPFPIDPLPSETDGTWAGKWNTFVGMGAGVSNRSGNMNVFLGSGAGNRNTIGDQNTFLGAFAGQLMVDGYHNTFVGTGAGQDNTNSAYNVFLGTDSGLHSYDGDYNTALGVSSGGHLTANGDYNTFLGYTAGHATTSGRGNTYLGAVNSHLETTGDYNTIVGFQSFDLTASGDFNTLLGANAARAFHSGTNNIFIGHGADVQAAVATNLYNSVAIGADAEITNNNQIVIGNSSHTEATIYGTVYIPTAVAGTRAITAGNGDASSVPSMIIAASDRSDARMGAVWSNRVTALKADALSDYGEVFSYDYGPGVFRDLRINADEILMRTNVVIVGALTALNTSLTNTSGQTIAQAITAATNGLAGALGSAALEDTSAFLLSSAGLDSLADVSIDTPLGGHILAYDGSVNWTNGPAAFDAIGTAQAATNGLTFPLDTLSDVAATGPTAGDVIAWGGSSWTNGPPSGAASVAMDDITDVTITSATAGDHIAWSGSAWTNGPASFDELAVTTLTATTFSFTNVSGADSNMVLVLDTSTNAVPSLLATNSVDATFFAWVESQSAAGATGLDDLSDVIIDTPLANHILACNESSVFTNGPAAFDAIGAALAATNGLGSAAWSDTTDFDAAGTAQAATNGLASILGSAALEDTSAFLLSTAGLDDLADAAIDTPIAGHILAYNGSTAFTNGPIGNAATVTTITTAQVTNALPAILTNSVAQTAVGATIGTADGANLTNLTYLVRTNALNTGVITVGQTLITNVAGNITLGGFSGLNNAFENFAAVLVIPDGTTRTVTLAANIFSVDGENVYYATNGTALKLQFSIVPGVWTNCAAVHSW